MAQSLSEIWEGWRASGDPADRERLITLSLPLVQRVAGRLAASLPPHIRFDDLYSVGIGGLLKAVDGYEANRQAKFESYATLLIRGAMIDELRRQNWAPRSVYAQAAKVAKAQRALERELGRPASDEETAAKLGMSVAEFSDALTKIRPTLFLSLDEKGEQIPDGRARSGADVAARNERRQLVRGAVAELPDQERKVVELYYYDELMLREIGELLGVGESRISQIHTKALLRLRERMREFDGD